MNFENIMIETTPELFSEEIFLVQNNFSLSEPFLRLYHNKGFDQKAPEMDEKNSVMRYTF